MMSSKELTRISKVLSLVLRHQPQLIGIAPDQHGWVDVTLLIQQMNIHNMVVDRALLDHVVETIVKNGLLLATMGSRYELARAIRLLWS